MNAVRRTLPTILVLGILVQASHLTAGESSSGDTGVRNDFSNASLNDRYGFHTLAFSGDVPFAISGFYRFNGNGRLTGRDVVSAAGADESAHGVAEREYEGRYEVRANGTGTLTLDLAPDFQPTGHFVIVDDGAAIEIIFAVEGNANAFTLRKQNT